jgi:glycosyltransferase involved in cell wall biosynthesis
VILTGERPHEEIPSYLAGFDVAIIPYRVSPAMAAASPVKLREYLAAGLPVVSVDVPEVREFGPTVRVASGPVEFLEHIEAAVVEKRARRRKVPKTASWDERADEMAARMDEALLARR